MHVFRRLLYHGDMLQLSLHLLLKDRARFIKLTLILHKVSGFLGLKTRLREYVFV